MDNMEQERQTWVRGNTLSLGIPLQTKTVEGKTVTTDDYYPPAGSEIHVFMVNQLTKREYEYTVDGNVVKFTDDGSLPLGVWGIEITVKEPTPHNYRTFECQEIEVVECSDALGDLPDGTILTSPAIFIQGPKGDPFTYDDFTPEQIEDLKKPATDAAADVAALEAQIEEAERGRVLAEQGRVQAENRRVSAEEARELAEGQRQRTFEVNEGQRQSDYEAAERQRNSDYQTAEGQRDSTFQAAEQTRQRNESDRQSAEEGRVSAEGLRVEAESGRVLAEEGRVEAEGDRVSAEQGRVEAEQHREETFAGYEQTFTDIDSRLDTLEGSLYITEEQFNEIFT